MEAFNVDMCLSKVNLLLIWMPRYFDVVQGGIRVLPSYIRGNILVGRGMVCVCVYVGNNCITIVPGRACSAVFDTLLPSISFFHRS